MKIFKKRIFKVLISLILLSIFTLTLFFIWIYSFFPSEIVSQQIKKILSEQYDLNVHFEKIILHHLNQFSLTNFIIEDSIPSPISLGNIDISFKILPLIQKKIIINKIKISGLYINLQKNNSWNYDYFLKKFQSSDNKESKDDTPFDFLIDIKDINLNKLTFLMKNNHEKYFIENLNIDISNLDYQKNLHLILKIPQKKIKFAVNKEFLNIHGHIKPHIHIDMKPQLTDVKINTSAFIDSLKVGDISHKNINIEIKSNSKIENNFKNISFTNTDLKIENLIKIQGKGKIDLDSNNYSSNILINNLQIKDSLLSKIIKDKIGIQSQKTNINSNHIKVMYKDDFLSCQGNLNISSNFIQYKDIKLKKIILKNKLEYNNQQDQIISLNSYIKFKQLNIQNQYIADNLYSTLELTTNLQEINAKLSNKGYFWKTHFRDHLILSNFNLNKPTLENIKLKYEIDINHCQSQNLSQFIKLPVNTDISANIKLEHANNKGNLNFKSNIHHLQYLLPTNKEILNISQNNLDISSTYHINNNYSINTLSATLNLDTLLKVSIDNLAYQPNNLSVEKIATYLNLTSFKDQIEKELDVNFQKLTIENEAQFSMNDKQIKLQGYLNSSINELKYNNKYGADVSYKTNFLLKDSNLYTYHDIMLKNILYKSFFNDTLTLNFYGNYLQKHLEINNIKMNLGKNLYLAGNANIANDNTINMNYKTHIETNFLEKMGIIKGIKGKFVSNGDFLFKNKILKIENNNHLKSINFKTKTFELENLNINLPLNLQFDTQSKQIDISPTQASIGMKNFKNNFIPKLEFSNINGNIILKNNQLYINDLYFHTMEGNGLLNIATNFSTKDFSSITNAKITTELKLAGLKSSVLTNKISNSQGLDIHLYCHTPNLNKILENIQLKMSITSVNRDEAGYILEFIKTNTEDTSINLLQNVFNTFYGLEIEEFLFRIKDGFLYPQIQIYKPWYLFYFPLDKKISLSRQAVKFYLNNFSQK